MLNPYEAQSVLETYKQRRTPYGHIAIALVLGYAAPIVILALLASINYGWPVALQNLDRVWRLHSKLSLNTIAAFVPNVVLALTCATAVSKWNQADDSHPRWWIFSVATLTGYAIVLFSLDRWNLIPWTWPSEIHNSIRSLCTMIFPIIAYVVPEYVKRRTKRWTEGPVEDARIW